MKTVDAREWSTLSDEEKTKYFATVGDISTVMSLVKQGALDGLPEAKQREIVADALTVRADLRDEKAAQGIYLKVAWENPEMALFDANFSPYLRAKATEILWNPDGLDLKQQLKGIFDKI